MLYSNMIKIEVNYNVIPRLDRGIQKTNTSKLKEFQYITERILKLLKIACEKQFLTFNIKNFSFK